MGYTLVEVPQAVVDLVEHFDRNIDAYKNQAYKEANLRQEFLDPFFEALGWDVRNKRGAAPQYRDVIFEDSIKVAKGTKAPDYCFTLSGRKMFFVEAKKPSVNIKMDVQPAYQLRRYAWSAKLPVSILTDFEELSVYECRQRPKIDDKASTERVLYLTYKDYIERWDEIYNTFSYEAVLQGSFDKFAAEAKKKRGTATIDDEFLKEIEGWRDSLARNIALRNPYLLVRYLNQSVQKTIDRIIFLRMCEDRGIEPYGQLQELGEKENIYAGLCKIYLAADDKYNSGLFHFKEERGRTTLQDDLTLKLNIDDKVLKSIIKALYYPDSPYEFSVLPPEILGNVYEQFLGKVIRLTEGHRAKVEDKPEVKKAGGVYYTPQYIVDYIVEKTVGELCKNKTPNQVSELRVLDPACGSGSFLLGAYTYLLKYHLDYYTSLKNPEKMREQIYQGRNGQWFLTIKEKKRILLNNIYGVDIDQQAVEVTKLSLLLKVLEGENRDVFEAQQKLWRERALPDLGTNIKCGNSLIGPDYYHGQQTTLLDNEEEMLRVNVFDWEKEFAEIMGKGGFDAVIGNPPYVRQELLADYKSYFQRKYETYHGVADLYVYFIERALALTKKRGLFSYIVSNKWMRARYGGNLRKHIIDYQIKELIDFGELKVFQDASTFPLIMIMEKSKPKSKTWYAPIKRLDFISLQEEIENVGYEIEKDTLQEQGFSLVSASSQKIIERIKESSVPLGQHSGGAIRYGIKTGYNTAFIIDKSTKDELVKIDSASEEIIVPFVVGNDIRKYRIVYTGKYLIFTRHGIDIDKYPAIRDYLSQWKGELTPKRDKKEKVGRKPGPYHWYEIQDTVEYYEDFQKEKIIYPIIAKESRFTLDRTGAYSNDKTFILPSGDSYLLGILNSKLIWFYLRSVCSCLGDVEKKGRLELRGIYVSTIPIRTVNFSDPVDKARRDKMVSLVERMLDLHKKLASTETEHTKKVFQSQIENTDKEINQLVYELYDLTPEEICIVEEAVGK